ncbi:MAG: hypothetical protein ACFE8J_03060 [Candidatus Heimdallarchaeota archaeon]
MNKYINVIKKLVNLDKKSELKVVFQANMNEQKDKGKEAKYTSKEELDLEIPVVPEAPKQKNKITKESPGLSTELLEKMKRLESDTIKVVLVNCERCKAVIPVPVPKKIILKSELPVVPFSFVHKNPIKKDQHCITIHLDHDFDIRRQRISDVTVSKD